MHWKTHRINKRHSFVVGVFIILMLLVANFLGVTRIAGYEWYVGLSSGRTKKMNYLFFIPISSTVFPNALSVAINHPLKKTETWELSVSRPILRRAPNTATGKALWLVNHVSQYVELNPQASTELILDVTNYISARNWDALKKYMEHIDQQRMDRTDGRTQRGQDERCDKIPK